MNDATTPQAEKPKRVTWSIDPDPVSERLVGRAMKERPGVSRTYILLECIKTGLRKYAAKKDKA